MSLMARLELQQQAAKANVAQLPKPQTTHQRVGEILSDHSVDLSSSDEDNTKPGRVVNQTLRLHADDTHEDSKDQVVSSPGSDDSDFHSGLKVGHLPVQVHQKPTGSFSSSTSKSVHKKSSKKWYSESEEEEDADDDEEEEVGGEQAHDDQDDHKPPEPKTQSQPQSQPTTKPKDDPNDHDDNDTDSDLSDLERKVASAALHKRKNSNSSIEPTSNEPTKRDIKSTTSQIRNLSELFAHKTRTAGSGAAAKPSETNTNFHNNKANMTLPQPQPQPQPPHAHAHAHSQLMSPSGVTGSSVQVPEKKKTGFQKLVDKTRTLSPFSSKRKGFFESTPPPPAPTAAAAAVAAVASSVAARSMTTQGHARPAPVQTQGSMPVNLTTVASSTRPRAASSSLATDIGSQKDPELSQINSNASMDHSRRPSRLKQSPPSQSLDPNALEVVATNLVAPPPSSGGFVGGSSVTVTSPPSNDVFSPSQRKLAGAFAGKSGSGVLLEGWLRQKQRRGVKGMKKWNSRYFVLYARTNEVRYYTDVVQSAWGPIPLGELGSISLRLIQRIGKPSHPKYKGCRFDITCRNTWGTHYADDYVSSDEDNDENTAGTTNANAVNAANAANTNATAIIKAGSGANTTPKSSRVYSLMADSPQTAVTWVNMLDSLLVRSANSPRPDISPGGAAATAAACAGGAGGGSGGGGTTDRNNSLLKRIPSSKIITRRRSSTLEMETSVLVAPNQHVPKAVVYAINFIFDSTPGIETFKFYESDAESLRMRHALKFLNQFAVEPWLSSNKTATKDELDQVLDVVTASSIIKLWLKQLETPLIPFEMFDDFQTISKEIKSAPFEYQRHLKALVALLPPKNFAMLACLLFHLNDVFVYASKNGMDAPFLANCFGDFILRPKKPSSSSSSLSSSSSSLLAAKERQATLQLVEEMILHVDTLIDEKEAQVLNKL